MCLGIPGMLIERYCKDDLEMGRVDFGGVVREVCLAYEPEAAIGDYLLVHAGFAIGRVDELEAQETLRLLDEMAEAAEDATDST